MRCKKHVVDGSSTVGVCASCLRERLFALIAAQAQAQAQTQENHRKSDAKLPPAQLPFPRSVSPYITRRKSDLTTANWQFQYNSHLGGGISDQRFFSTPQVVGPTAAMSDHKKNKKKNSAFSLFSGLFRSKTKRSDPAPVPDPDPKVSNYKHHCPASSSSSSSSWFSILTGRRKKQSRTFSLDESTMSPARFSNEEEIEHCGSEESPRRTPAAAQPGRIGKSGHSRSLSGLGFCLSPLVRASPSRQWNHQKGMTQPEMVFPGDTKVPAKPHLSNVTSFCKNRSRKIADFGRFNSHR